MLTERVWEFTRVFPLGETSLNLEVTVGGQDHKKTDVTESQVRHSVFQPASLGTSPVLDPHSAQEIAWWEGEEPALEVESTGLLPILPSCD